MIKKLDQENNISKHRRIHSAYKRLLVDKMQEKDDRLKAMQSRREKI